MEWTCQQCGARNQDNDYRCRQCNMTVKPYTLKPVFTDSPSHSPPSSLTHTGPGGLDEDTGPAAAAASGGYSALGPRPTVPPLKAEGHITASSSSALPPPPSPWGGARPKRQPLGHASPDHPEDRRPLLSGADSLDFDLAPSGDHRHPHHHHSRMYDHSPVAGRQGLSFPDSECRLILIGRTGNGKSSAGNTIVGMTHFQEGVAFNSETRTCQMKRVTRFGIDLEVVDTPGFFDTSTPEEELFREIRKCIGMVSPGPHALALVIGGRFTSEQVETVEQIRALFGSEVLGHMLVIFTFGDQLTRGQGEVRCDDIIRHSLDNAPPELKTLIRTDLENRYVVFNNRGSLAEKDGQVQELLRVVGDIVRSNVNRPFSASLLEECEKVIINYEARVLGMLNNTDDMTRGQVRRVFRQLMDRDQDTGKVLEELLTTQKEATDARIKLEETNKLMEKMIRDHKAKTDQLMTELATQRRRKCVIL